MHRGCQGFRGARERQLGENARFRGPGRLEVSKKMTSAR
jgi:hypothetical protein